MGLGKLIRTITRGGLAVYVAWFGIRYNNSTIALANEFPKEQTLEERMSAEEKIDFIVDRISGYSYEGLDQGMLNDLKEIKKEISLDGKLRIIDGLFDLEKLKEYKTENGDVIVYTPAPNGIGIYDTRPEDKEVIINIGGNKARGKKFDVDKFGEIYELVENKGYGIVFLKFGSQKDNPAILLFKENNLKLLHFSDSTSFYLESK